jgi:hypothetical protein
MTALQKVHLPFDMLTALSKAEGSFDRPLDRLMALSKAEGQRTDKYTSFLKIHTPCI